MHVMVCTGGEKKNVLTLIMKVHGNFGNEHLRRQNTLDRHHHNL